MKAPHSRFFPLDEQNLERARTWRNQARIRRNMLSDSEISPEQQGIWFAGLKKDPRRTYFVYAQDGRSVGMLYFTDISSRDCRIGFYLGEEAVWPGSGLLLEIAALDYALAFLGLDKIIAEVLDFNLPPQRMHAIFGFKLDGRKSSVVFRDGVLRDLLCYSCTAWAWRANRESVISKLPAQIQQAAKLIVFN